MDTQIGGARTGYPLEQNLYKGLSLTQFVQRLLDKRCVAFVGGCDSYILMSGHQGIGGESFTKIGTPAEKVPLVLTNCLSYDEMKLSAFLPVSSHTELINDGNRYNMGEFAKDLSKIEREGVVVGLIGARFEKPLFMEYQDIIVSAQQNTPQNGYGYDGQLPEHQLVDNPPIKCKIDKRKLWQKFYEDQNFLYSENLKQNPRFAMCPGDKMLFDNIAMKKRYAITFDTLLMEAQARAELCGQQAYIHVVGIGLGVWKIAEHQSKIFLETFSQRVRHLLPRLNNIGVVHFSWFYTTESSLSSTNFSRCQMTEWHDLKHNGLIESPTHPLGGIRVYMKNRNPADKLKGEHADKLLVISYAWDGNALPGNEFWQGSLDGSNDPSTAASTLITELHNPHINGGRVCGENLHVASVDNGISHIGDYVKLMADKL